MKRIISLMLSLCVIANLLPIRVYAEDTFSESSTKRYETVFQFDESSNETEINSIMVIDNCVYADLHWIISRLNLQLSENKPGHYLTDRYKSSSNLVVRQMVSGYDSCFKTATNETEYVLAKPNVDLQFFFREGSSAMYAYSEYLGELTADLGGSIVTIPDQKNSKNYTTWIPLVMFLYIFDSSLWIDGTTIHILPCSLTAVDVLHTPNLGELFYDPVVDGGISNTISNVKRGYITFYNKVKKLFQGLIHLDPKDVMSSFSIHDYEEISNALALQLCTPNEAELAMLKRISSETGCNIIRDYSTLLSTGDKVESLNSDLSLATDGSGVIFDVLEDLSKTVSKGTAVKADDLLARLSGKNWDAAFESADDVSKAVKKAVDAANTANTARKWASGIKYTGVAVSFAAPIFLTYITSANEIASSVQTYNDAVQNYISEFGNSPNVYMPEEIINILNEKSKMYQKQDISIYNDELALNMSNSALASGVEFLGSAFIESINSSFGQWQLVSIGWDVGEWLANGVSGGAFDSLNALNNSTAALMLEYDSEQVLRSFKTRKKDSLLSLGDLDYYRSLELVRLKSYLIAREDTLGYYKFWEKKKPNQFPYVEAEITKDEEPILRYMAALLSPNSGVTIESLEAHEKSMTLMNKLIVLSGALCDMATHVSVENRIVEKNSDSLMCGIITGTADNGAVIWAYKTDEYPATDAGDVIIPIGIHNDKYYFVEMGKIKVFNLADGAPVWEWNGLDGYAEGAADFGDDETLYISGYLSPVFVALDKNGKLIKKIDSFGDDIYWAHKVEYQGDKIAIYFECDYPDLIRYISLKDYSVVENTYEFLRGKWENVGGHPAADSIFTFSGKTILCDYLNGEYGKIAIRDIIKTSYGYFLKMGEKGAEYGYRLENETPDYLRYVETWDPYSLDGYSGSSSLVKHEVFRAVNCGDENCCEDDLDCPGISEEEILEEELDYIRSIYYDTENSLSKYKKTTGSYGITYYTEGEQLKKIRIPSGFYSNDKSLDVANLYQKGLENYTAEFYYDDGQNLVFVFVFNNSTEYRYYICDNSCIRWIDPKGKEHDSYEGLDLSSEFTPTSNFCVQGYMEPHWAGFW